MDEIKRKKLYSQLESHRHYLILGHSQEYQRGLPLIYVPVEDDKPVKFFKEDLLSVHYFNKISKIVLFTFSQRVFGTSKPVHLFIILPGQEDMEKFLQTWNKVSKQIPREMEIQHLKMVEREMKITNMVSGDVEAHGSMKEDIYLFNSFIQFVTKNVGKSNETLKKIIDDIEDLPSFLHSHGLDTQQQSIKEWFLNVLEIFRERNKCALDACEGFSLKRCRNCRTHYCNEICQKSDFAKHKKDCKNLRREQKFSLNLGRTLEKILVERLAMSNRCFKFDTFKTKLTQKMFDKSFNLLFSEKMHVKTPEENWQRWLPLVSSELSSEPLDVQFDKAWGFSTITETKGFHFSINWKKSCYWFLFLITVILCSL